MSTLFAIIVIQFWESLMKITDFVNAGVEESTFLFFRKIHLLHNTHLNINLTQQALVKWITLIIIKF